MNIDKLKNIAEYHAKYNIRTTCEYFGIAEEYHVKADYYVFYAIYRCKRRLNIRRIALTKDGEYLGFRN